MEKYFVKENISEQKTLKTITFSKKIENIFFRDFFDLAQDGSCEFAQLAANDAHGTQMGSWEYNAGEQLIMIRSQEGNVVRRLIIENAAENLLMIRE